MKTGATDNTLLVVLESEPLIFLEGADFDVPRMIGGRKFRDCGLGKVVGHFDWLHTAEDRLVGLRTQPFVQPGLDEILSRLARHPSIEISGRDFCVFLTPCREFSDELSDDFEFGLNWILVADDGTLALTYTLLRSEREMATLNEWVQQSVARGSGARS
jgi:hypothetical protein